MGRWCRLAGALVAAFVIAAAANAQGESSIYGKRLVQAHDVPAEALARFARHDDKLRAKGDKPGLMSGGSEDWSAQPLPLPTDFNPYRLVIRVSGTALADGDTGSLWLAGWGDGEGGSREFPVSGAAKPGAKAGERVELVGASTPVSFRKDGTLRPAVSFLGTQNLRVDEVKLEVWAGVGKSSFVERVGAWSPLLVGLVFLGLFLWFRRS